MFRWYASCGEDLFIILIPSTSLNGLFYYKIFQAEMWSLDLSDKKVGCFPIESDDEQNYREWSTRKDSGAILVCINPLTPNDHYSGRTAPLTSKSCMSYIYSTNTGTEYFRHGIYSTFFLLSSKCSLFHNTNVFVSCIIQILYTECAKNKKIIPAPKG